MKNDTIDGLDSMLKVLTTLEAKSADKVLSAMIRGRMAPIQNQMRKDVDRKVKEGRKGVRSRFKNKKKKNEITAKVGFGIGKKTKRANAKLQRKIKRTTGKQGGVGISAQNIHWWVAGTRPRYAGISYRKNEITGSRIHSTGAMPAMQPGLAAIAATKSAGQQNKEMIRRGALALQKEIVKLKTIR